MGNTSQKITCTLTQAELESYSQKSKNIFTADEVKALWFHFNMINAFSGYISIK
jgi:hypothetical protein